MSATINPDPLLDKQEAGEYLNEEPRTLDNKRSRGTGPNFIKLGHLVRYRKSDLDKYIEMRTIRLDGNKVDLSGVILGNPNLKSRVGHAMNVTPEIAQRYINNTLRILELAGS